MPFCACTQNYLPISWEDLNGKVDTGRLWRFPVAISSSTEISFGWPKSGTTRSLDLHPGNGEQLRWAVFQSDTILLRIDLRGENLLLQKLYAGEISLFRSIDRLASDRLYWRDNHGEWYYLHPTQAKEAAFGMIRQTCSHISRQKRKINSIQEAIALTYKINECISVSTHYPVHPYLRQRHRFGLGWVPAQHRYYTAISGFDFSESIEYPIQVPNISLVYDYRFSRKYPFLLAQLQARLYWQNQETKGQSLVAREVGVPVSDQLTRAGLYLYPGIGYELGFNRSFTPMIGIGLAISMPFYFRRTIEQTNPAESLVGYPIKQVIRRGTGPSVGTYFQVGTRLRLTPKIMLGVVGRFEYLRQRWLYFSSDQVLYSTVFRNQYDLGSFDQQFLQLQLLYNW